MSTEAEHVVHSTGLVKAVANEAASSAQNVSAAAEEQLAANEEITASAHSLSKMADDLQNEMSQFKL